jgi:hypothetical protein
MIDAARLAVDEIARIQCSIINVQYAVKKMQLFDARIPPKSANSCARPVTSVYGA